MKNKTAGGRPDLRRRLTLRSVGRLEQTKKLPAGRVRETRPEFEIPASFAAAAVERKETSSSRTRQFEIPSGKFFLWGAILAQSPMTAHVWLSHHHGTSSFGVTCASDTTVSSTMRTYAYVVIPISATTTPRLWHRPNPLLLLRLCTFETDGGRGLLLLPALITSPRQFLAY